MKTFFKKNVMAAFAILLALSTMSFQLIKKESTSAQWYPVATDGYTITSSDPIDKPNNPDCQENNPASVCAVEIELTAAPFPSNLDDAATYHNLTGNTTERLNW